MDRVLAQGEARAGAGGDGCRCRAKIHPPRLALIGALVNLALLRRHADRDLWANVIGCACDCDCRTAQCVMWSIEGARDRLEPVPKHSQALCSFSEREWSKYFLFGPFIFVKLTMLASLLFVMQGNLLELPSAKAHMAVQMLSNGEGR